jgi:hypothetical protein
MIRITQTCDRCLELRYLSFAPSTTQETLRTMGESSGWREVRSNVHLCGPCIVDALSQRVQGEEDDE